MRRHIESFDVRRGPQRKIHLDAAAVAEFVALPQAFGDDEDVAEQNGGIEIKTADGLQGDFGGQFGGADQVEKGCFSLSWRYSGNARPAWRISQTGGRSTVRQRQASRKRSRLVSAGAPDLA